jgi:hypothetical protein
LNPPVHATRNTQHALDVYLVTCVRYPAGPDDDAPLVAACAAQGLRTAWAVWDDPAVDWAAAPVAVIRATWDYHHRRAEFLAWADRVAALTDLWNPASTIRWNTHKGYLRDLEAAGIPCVPTAWLAAGRLADLAALLAERNWTDVVIKPAVSADSFATRRVAAADLAAGQGHLDTHLPARDMMIQPFLPSVLDYGERSLIAINGEITHAVIRTPLGGSAHLPPAPTLTTSAPDERDLAARILAGLTPTPLYARVDLARTPDGVPCLMELELVEPSLFFRLAPTGAHRLAAAIALRAERET